VTSGKNEVYNDTAWNDSGSEAFESRCGFLSCSAAIVHASGSVRGGGDRSRIHGFLGALHSLGKGTSQEKGRDSTGTLTVSPDLRMNSYRKCGG